MGTAGGVAGTNSLDTSNTVKMTVLNLGGTDVTATAAELNYLDLTGLGTGVASEAVVLDSGEDYVWPSGGKLTYGGTQITATGAELNYNDITTLGTAEASKTLTVNAAKQLVWTTTSASTVDPIAFTSTMTGAGTTGGRANFRMNAEAALGGWSNALKAHVVYGASASTSGLGSALVAEIQLGAANTVGHYAPIESEIVIGSGGKIGGGTSFLYLNVNDDGTTWNDGGYFFEMGTGVADTNGGMFDAESKSTIGKTHTLRILVNDVIYYIALHTSQAFGGS